MNWPESDKNGFGPNNQARVSSVIRARFARIGMFDKSPDRLRFHTGDSLPNR